MPILLAGKMREPWETEYFQSEIEPLLGDGVQYLGEVPHEEKLRLLGAATATLFPIRWNEPFGLVLLESLASGDAGPGLSEGAAREVVADGCTGYLSKDTSDMAARLRTVDEIDRTECRADVEVRFSTARMAREHADLFGRVLSRPT